MVAVQAQFSTTGQAIDSTLPVLDRAYLARFTFGNDALEREVLGLFADQAPRYLEALVDARDAKGWKEAAHTLKGSAAAVGAKAVAQRAALAEQLVPHGTAAMPSGPDRDQAIAALRDAVAHALRAIAAL